MSLFGEVLQLHAGIILLFALGLALAFEFVNGFHDTANAVATVIYTHSLKPMQAVVWSGLWNLIGVLTSSGAVAFGVVSLLPVELVLNVGSAAGFAMVFSLLTSAMVWNLGTWYFGLPASSSHALIGSILGVGLANSVFAHSRVFGEGVNWGQAYEVFASLLISPVLGFGLAALLLVLLKRLIKRPEMFRSAEPGKAPPFWVRATLLGTCTGVSFAHGSNDGQKGMGLIMLILIGVLPAAFALNLQAPAADLQELRAASQALDQALGDTAADSAEEARGTLSAFVRSTDRPASTTRPALRAVNAEVLAQLTGRGTFTEVPREARATLRRDLYLIEQSVTKLGLLGQFAEPAKEAVRKRYEAALRPATRFIPWWVKLAVAVALGLGTMIGWKRIVVTVGEKIGKQHLSYAQGASAEIVAMVTIGAADAFGLPVSTTHVLSSGVAGTMFANRSGVNMGTLRSLLLAWVLTLPVCVFIGAGLFALGLNIIAAAGTR
ncbi:inorganic phosphate transporter [Paludibaculum fermentans]|uniref:inorganic phosphate transporter n=1 Tax=Paludibaculum fermentans TaxID=1473598 RepID=UPI001E3E3DE4|nr:inorganic phosphate transporter [Paludibaculum fermentans]